MGRTPDQLGIPEGCSLFAVIRGGTARALSPDTVLQVGDKVIAIGQPQCERVLHEQLIGTAERLVGDVGGAGVGAA